MKLPNNLLTIYGRKPVLEALKDNSIEFFRLHLATSNQDGGIVSEIQQLAARRNIEVVFHDRMGLSRISKNKKQDQGVAADIVGKNFKEFESILNINNKTNIRLVAIDNITNPSNLGMIIRTVCASPFHGIILPRKGCAKIDSLVIKASTGAVFQCNIYFCDSLPDAMRVAKKNNIRLYSMSTAGSSSIFELSADQQSSIFVFGNETNGISKNILDLCDAQVHIPMSTKVESLNVAVAVGVIVFHFNNN